MNPTNIVHRGVDFVAVGAKWFSNPKYDIIIRWDTIPNNLTRGFYSVVCVPNESDTPLNDPQNYDKNSSGALNMAEANNTEYIGPLNIEGLGWTGGAHLHGDGSKSSVTLNFDVTANGTIVSIGSTVSAKEVEIVIVNSLLEDNAGGNIQIGTETQKFKCYNGAMYPHVKIDFLTDMTLYQYYGLQLNTSSYFDKVYVADSDSEIIKSYTSGYTSGTRDLYPNISHACVGKEDGSQYVCMELDRSFGLGLNSPAPQSKPWFFVSGVKSYYHLIDWKPYTTGDSVEWKGVYSWHSDPEDVENVYYYPKIKNVDSFRVAVNYSQAGSGALPINTNGGTVTLLENIKGGVSLGSPQIVNASLNTISTKPSNAMYEVNPVNIVVIGDTTDIQGEEYISLDGISNYLSCAEVAVDKIVLEAKILKTAGYNYVLDTRGALGTERLLYTDYNTWQPLGGLIFSVNGESKGYDSPVTTFGERAVYELSSESLMPVTLLMCRENIIQFVKSEIYSIKMYNGETLVAESIKNGDYGSTLLVDHTGNGNNWTMIGGAWTKAGVDEVFANQQDYIDSWGALPIEPQLVYDMVGNLPPTGDSSWLGQDVTVTKQSSGQLGMRNMRLSLGLSL